jgi:hypothetical protein
MGYSKAPAITGWQLIALLKKDGWETGRKARHGRTLTKQVDGITKVTFVKETKSPIVDITLGQILGVKQTGIGKAGLTALIQKFGT